MPMFRRAKTGLTERSLVAFAERCLRKLRLRWADSESSDQATRKTRDAVPMSVFEKFWSNFSISFLYTPEFCNDLAANSIGVCVCVRMVWVRKETHH